MMAVIHPKNIRNPYAIIILIFSFDAAASTPIMNIRSITGIAIIKTERIEIFI